MNIEILDTKILKSELNSLSEKKKDIKLTVALPMYMSKHSVFLALESLALQKDIDFLWELIILEEKIDPYAGLDFFNQYWERLQEVNCVKLVYNSLEQWIPLSKKWLILSKLCSDTSQTMLLQASDCYNQPYRLKETLELFEEHKADWVNNFKGAFYDIGTTQIVLYKSNTNPGLSMAINPNVIKNIQARNYPKRYIDRWLMNNGKAMKRNFRIVNNNSENWIYSVDTNGLNKISTGRQSMMKRLAPPFYKYNKKIEDILPPHVVEMIGKATTFINSNKTVS